MRSSSSTGLPSGPANGSRQLGYSSSVPGWFIVRWSPVRSGTATPSSLATVTTHDLPPTAGYLSGAHIDLRHDLGLLTRPVEQERKIDEAARQEVLDMLVERGLLQIGRAHV